MALTDQQILSEIQAHLIEPEDNGATFPSGLWTPAEVLDLLTARERRFLHDTDVVLTETTIAGAANMHRVALPQTTMRVADLTFERAGGTFHPLTLSELWAADLATPLWEQTQADAPDTYDTTTPETLEVVVTPAPRDAGIFHLLFLAVSAALTGAGATFTVPDLFLPPVKWGVIADMLGKVGEAQDPVRAAYAEERYQEGVIAAQIWMAALFAPPGG